MSVINERLHINSLIIDDRNVLRISTYKLVCINVINVFMLLMHQVH